MPTYERIGQLCDEVVGKDMTVATLDPLDMAELIMAVEEEFDLLIADDDSLHTIDDLMAAINVQYAVA